MVRRLTDDELWFEDDTTPDRRSAPGWARAVGRDRTRLPSTPPRVRAGIARLAVAAAVLIGLAVLVGTVVSGSDRAGSDRSYLIRLTVPAHDSSAVGAAFSRLLSRRQLTMSGLESLLAGLVGRQERDTIAAIAIQPSPTLRTDYARALDAMQVRERALADFLTAVRTAGTTAATLAALGVRLVASDVIWRDVFMEPAERQLQRDGLRGVEPPQSTFLANPGLADLSSLAAFLTRLRSPAKQQLATLKAGDVGPAVRGWQKQLNSWLARERGLQPLTIDGVYGQATVAATTRFQSAARLATDGVAGPATRAALAKALR